MINLVVAIQVLTMLVLGAAWYHAGNWRLACAQFCYAAATVVLFARLS